MTNNVFLFQQGGGYGGRQQRAAGNRESPKENQLSQTNLYIRGLSEDTTDETLREMCQEFGNIVSTKAILDKQTGKCKGAYFYCSLDDINWCIFYTKHFLTCFM